jgi:hypothetical protein
LFELTDHRDLGHIVVYKATDETWILPEMRLRPPRYARPVPGMRNNSAAVKGNRFGVNHSRMIALHFMHYNYCRVHQTLRVTPAMQAGLTDHIWEIGELVGLLD